MPYPQEVIVTKLPQGDTTYSTIVRLEPGSEVDLAAGALVGLVPGTTIALASGTLVGLVSGTTVTLAGVPTVALASGTTVALTGTVTLAGGTAVALAAGSQVIGSLRANQTAVTMTVANGAVQTAIQDIRGYNRFGLWVPTTFDGSTITLSVGVDGVNVQPLRDIRNQPVQVAPTVVAGTCYDLPGELDQWPYVRFVCGTTQSGATDFMLVMKY